MTKEDCHEKIEELKKQALQKVNDRINHILNSGFIDFHSYNGYIVPSIILAASLDYVSKQLAPDTSPLTRRLFA